MMAATIPGIAAMVSRKIARLRIFSLVTDPKFHNVAKTERKERGIRRRAAVGEPILERASKTMFREYDVRPHSPASNTNLTHLTAKNAVLSLKVTGSL